MSIQEKSKSNDHLQSAWVINKSTLYRHVSFLFFFFIFFSLLFFFWTNTSYQEIPFGILLRKDIDELIEGKAIRVVRTTETMSCRLRIFNLKKEKRLMGNMVILFKYLKVFHFGNEFNFVLQSPIEKTKSIISSIYQQWVDMSEAELIDCKPLEGRKCFNFVFMF